MGAALIGDPDGRLTAAVDVVASGLPPPPKEMQSKPVQGAVDPALPKLFTLDTCVGAVVIEDPN